MEPGGSMQHSQGLSNNSYPDPKSTQFLALIPISSRSILILSSHLRLTHRKEKGTRVHLSRVTNNPSKNHMWLMSCRLATPVLYYKIHFTMQNLNLLEFLAEAFSAMCIIFNAWWSQWNCGTTKHCKWYTWHRKASAKNWSEDFA